MNNRLVTGDGIEHKPSDWKFDANVAEKFDAHVSKSVPYYSETQKLAVGISDWFVHDGGCVYDIGCATGTTIADLAYRHAGKQVHYIGIDRSVAMLQKAKERVNGLSRIQLLHEDVLEHSFPSDIDLVYSLYTLQFIDPHRRLELLTKIYNSMSCRGAIVLVEKVLDADPIATDIYIHLHWAKKVELGFEASEVYGKAMALRGVLVPFTLQENIDMLTRAGFSRVSTFWKWSNFAGLIAIK